MNITSAIDAIGNTIVVGDLVIVSAMRFSVVRIARFTSTPGKIIRVHIKIRENVILHVNCTDCIKLPDTQEVTHLLIMYGHETLARTDLRAFDDHDDWLNNKLAVGDRVMQHIGELSTILELKKDYALIGGTKSGWKKCSSLLKVDVSELPASDVAPSVSDMVPFLRKAKA